MPQCGNHSLRRKYCTWRWHRLIQRHGCSRRRWSRARSSTREVVARVRCGHAQLPHKQHSATRVQAFGPPRRHAHNPALTASQPLGCRPAVTATTNARVNKVAPLSGVIVLAVSRTRSAPRRVRSCQLADCPTRKGVPQLEWLAQALVPLRAPQLRRSLPSPTVCLAAHFPGARRHSERSPSPEHRRGIA